MSRRARLALALAMPLSLAVAGCAPTPRATLDPPAAPAAAPAPPPPPPPPQAVPPPPPATADACGAAQMQHLVGRPRTEIPVPVRPERHRVACTTCPVTEDYDPARLNFRFDAATGLIREIRCG